MLQIDRLAYESALSKKNPYLKTGLGFALLICAIVFDNIIVQTAIFLTAVFLTCEVGRTGIRDYLRLYKAPLAFIMLGTLAMLINISADGKGLISSINLGICRIGISKQGLNLAYGVIFRSISAISATFFIALSTPVNQMIKVFKSLRLPAAFIEQFILIYRFINLFMEELQSMNTAMELKHGYTGKRTWINAASLMGTGLFFRVMGSYGAWKEALDMKLFDGRFYY